MKVGILGTGFGSYHASIYSKLESIDSIIIFGRSKEKLDKLSSTMDIRTTCCIEDIITNPHIDLVDICLPSTIHRSYAIEALKNGKNVFCETPVCLSLEDAAAMKEAETKYGKSVFVNMFIKHEPPYKHLYEVLQNNTYGALKALHIRRKTPPLWGDLGLDNITTNLMIHDLDFVTWLLGYPSEVFAEGVEKCNGESHVNALLSYDEIIVEVQGSSMMPHYHPFTVGYEAIFENATIEFVEDGYSDKCKKSLILYTNESKKQLELAEKNCYEESIKHVIECCHNKKVSSILCLSDAAMSLRLALHIKQLITKKNDAL